MSAKLIWITPDADKVIGYCARVSNPANQDNPDITGLLRYMERNGHVSPFEMASACLEITTTRDIGRQILRHRSFSFQEFSGRYQTYDTIETAPLRECRMQDKTNRQSSLTCEDPVITDRWARLQREIYEQANAYYRSALIAGIAKEVARALLPEGLTTTRMYMSGTLRSWIHYLRSRLDVSTQKEHRQIAQEVLTLLTDAAPLTMAAFFDPNRDG